MRWSNRERGWRRHAGVLAALAAAAILLAAAQAPPAPTSAAHRFVVVIDAAHGGEDAGGRLGTQAEKNITLAVRLKLRSLLAERGIEVVSTREADATIALDHRAEVANEANAQACISLHATESGSGVHVFASSLAPAPPQRFAAWKTAQSAWVTRSLALTGLLNSALQHAGVPVTLGRISLPAVDSMACPAVAVEIAPVRSTNRGVTAELGDPGYQARVAEALAAALVEWRTDAARTEARQP